MRLSEDRSQKANTTSTRRSARPMHLLPTPTCGLMFVGCVAVMKSGCGIKTEKGLAKFQAQDYFPM
jgi:hypothetical protein